MSNIKVISQYIKDLSFEVPNAPTIFFNQKNKPNINLNIDIDAKKIAEKIFEVSLKITANAKSDDQDVFLIEVIYAAAFEISDVEENMLEQILLIYCPNLIFPFVRKIIANLTIDSGFPPLMLDIIDFAMLYQKRKKVADSEPISESKN
jgi:preprotein translocase subunit SecB